MTRRIAGVRDVELAMAQSKVYDLLVFASGFETRCMSVARLLRRRADSSTLVMGFHEHRGNPTRLTADRFYREEMASEPVIVPTGSPGAVAALMEHHFSSAGEECRIFVDISSMSRSWYADLINWARFGGSATRVQIDFCYMTGVYPDPYPPRMISEITSLFGFEGRSDLRLETVALIGLGYDAVTPHAVLEDLQPELTFGYVAGQVDEHSVLNALRVNAATIGEFDGPVTVVPLLSVEAAYSMLSDMIAPHAGNRNIVLVSLGPKTHVLAGLLVATRNEEVTCLHVRGRSVGAADVQSGRDVAVCSVTFEAVQPEVLQIVSSQQLEPA